MASKLLEDRDSSLFSPLIDLALSALGAIFLLFLIFLWFARPDPDLCEPLRFLDVNPDAIIAGQNYVFTFPVTGGCSGNRRFSLHGSLPDGLRFKTDSGTLYGVAEASRSGGTGRYQLDVEVVDDQNSDKRSAVLHLLPAAVPYDPNNPPFGLLRETARLPAARVGHPYEAVVGAHGGVEPYQWLSSPLPAGLKLENGLLRGVPQTAGSFDIQMSVLHTPGRFLYQGHETTWQGGVDEGNFKLRVLPELRHWLNLPSYARVGELSIVTVATNGLRASEAVDCVGGIPGLEVLEDGRTLAGTPTEAGDFYIAYQITEAGQLLGEGSGTLRVLPGVDFQVGGAVLQAWTGEDFRSQIPHQGGVEPISITATSQVPAGIRVEDQLLVGQPQGVGLITIGLEARDALGRKAEGQVTLRVGVRF